MVVNDLGGSFKGVGQSSKVSRDYLVSSKTLSLKNELIIGLRPPMLSWMRYGQQEVKPLRITIVLRMGTK